MKKTYTGKGRNEKEAIADAKKQIAKDAIKEIKKKLSGLKIKVKI